MAFKDHFSGHAAGYSQARPSYPEELFTFLAELCDEHMLAWDCATGNGQAAIALSPLFKQVVASDASAEQLAQASQRANIEYRVAAAEESFLAADSVDLLVVAQALHWFDQAKFFANASRVLKPSGVLAVLSYGIHSITPSVDAVVARLYEDILGDYWPPERRIVEAAYKGLEFPLSAVAAPEFTMSLSWTQEQLLAYLQSWSALQRYLVQIGENPIELIRQDLAAAWGREERREIVWPLSLIVRRG